MAILLAGCGPGEAPSVRDAALDTTADVPDARPAGFHGVDLIPAPDGPDGPAGAPAPAGSFWFHLSDGRTLEWFVRARHLTGGLAYRVELIVDGRARYSVASLRSDAAGTLVGHGVLDAFADRVCVGAEAEPPQPLGAAHEIGVAIKLDGSPSSRGAGGLPTAAASALPCTGNGDGRWSYILLGRRAVPLDERPTEPNDSGP